MPGSHRFHAEGGFRPCVTNQRLIGLTAHTDLDMIVSPQSGRFEFTLLALPLLLSHNNKASSTQRHAEIRLVWWCAETSR